MSDLQGQTSGDSFNQGGPSHHIGACSNSCGDVPLEAISAELDSVATYLHWLDGTFWLICPTLLATKVLSRAGDMLSQPRTTEESLQA